ncbi:MAG: hypothetical protein ACOC3I_00050 [Verrucomicrobiota bacterium]
MAGSAIHLFDATQRGGVAQRAKALGASAPAGTFIRLGGPELPARGWHRLGGLRRRYRRRLAAAGTDGPVIYHQLMGLDLFTGEDAGRHRYLWVHEPFVRWGTAMGWAARYADALLFDEAEWRDEVVRALRWMPAARLVVAPAEDALDAVLEELGQLPVKRRVGSPSRPLGLYGLYRQQIHWLA